MNEEEITSLKEIFNICTFFKIRYYNSENLSLIAVEESLINEKKLYRELWYSYVYILIDGTLKRFKKAKIPQANELNLLLNKKINDKTISKILYDFRNSTFHMNSKSFYNNEKKFLINLTNLDKEVLKIYNFYKKYLNNNYDPTGSLNKLFNSKFYKLGVNIINDDEK